MKQQKQQQHQNEVDSQTLQLDTGTAASPAPITTQNDAGGVAGLSISDALKGCLLQVCGWLLICVCMCIQ